MTASDPLTQALATIAPGRATLRRADRRVDVILDVTGLDPAVRDALETEVRAAAEAHAQGAAVRVALTSSRVQRRLIAVASGKGGVGKSTVAANLAVGLARDGRNVGLVDADIYGPSQPMLMAVGTERPQARDKVLIPVPTRWGVPVMSMGQLVPEGQAIAWRGPMAAGALGQLVEADWGAADTLVLDLPPGTGDVQLTMVQKYKPAGAVIVSTPQDLALIDARRALDLFQKAGVPIIGLIENMAGYVCPHCGETSDPFGRGGAEAAAAALGIAFLGRIPLDLAIRAQSDAGTPPAAGNGPEGRAFQTIADQVGAWLARGN